MTDSIPRFVRGIFFALLALIGLAMALVFMVSTAIAIGIMYLIAKIRGKPFGVRAYWAQRQAARSGPFGQAASFEPGNNGASRRPHAVRGDVIDVEAREVP
jgi:hypothetical protein